MKRRELFIHLSLPKAQKRPIVTVLMYTDDLIVVPEHDTGTVKLRARCFPRPALIGVELSGNLILVKGSVINTSDFLYLTQHVVIS